MDKNSVIEIRTGAVMIVKINKPLKKNAFDVEMYRNIKKIFDKVTGDHDLSTLVLTGVEDIYSSGNDFSAFTGSLENDIFALKEFIDAFITFPKLLIAVVNGPAIGIAATTLALCDIVYASENAYFLTPFTKLGIVAEGCSTFTFPRMIGDRKAAEMLLLSHKMSASEALACGFINYIYKSEEAETKVWNKIYEMSQWPIVSIQSTKKLMRNTIQDTLLKVNRDELDALYKVWTSGNDVKKSLKPKSNL